MNFKKPRYLSIEFPEDKAEVDFLEHGATVIASCENGVLHIEVRVSHGEDASSWDLHEFDVPLKKGEAK